MTFYEKCSEILKVSHEGSSFPYKKRTRWNNRAPGQGRFPGRGIIRHYGNVIHISLYNPSYNGIFETEEKVFEILKKLIDKEETNI